MLLASHDWRAVFLFGASVTAAFIPLVLLLVPETIALPRAQTRRAGALEKINRTLARDGPRRRSTALPPPSAGRAARRIADSVRARARARSPCCSPLAYFFHIMTFYFILKWVPKIVVDMGFAPSPAGGVLVWANVGGATGGALVRPARRSSATLRRLIVALLLGRPRW